MVRNKLCWDANIAVGLNPALASKKVTHRFADKGRLEWSQAAQVHNTRSFIVLFFSLLCERSAKRDSRLPAYGGVVLQRLEGLNF